MSVSSRLSFLHLSILWLAALVAFGYIHQKHFDNDLAVSRLDVLHSLFNYGQLTIDAYEANTNDKAFAGGHYYCDKAPGTILLALPGFFVSTLILRQADIPLDSKEGWLISSWLSVEASIGLITACGLVCLFLWLELFLPSTWGLITAFGIYFGSMVFPYATVFMSHSVVVGFISIALYLLRLGLEPLHAMQTPNAQGRDFLAGTSCGLAVSCEYSSALIVASILVFACYSNYRRAGYLSLGILPTIVLVFWYNWIATGRPFSLTYAHEVVFTQNHRGLYGISLPMPSHLLTVLFSPRQGLLFWSPFLWLACVGYFQLHRCCVVRFWMCYAAPLLHVLIMSGYYTVSAGDTFGSRFLSPILPLLSLPVGIAAVKIPRIASGLIISAVIMNSAAAFIDIQLPQTVKNPLLMFYIPHVLSCDFTYDVGFIVGLRGLIRIIPLLCTETCVGAYLWRRLRRSPHNRRPVGKPVPSALNTDR